MRAFTPDWRWAWALTLLLCVPGVPVAAAGNVVVAVFSITDATEKLPHQTTDALGDFLTGRLGEIPGWSIVPRDQVKSRLLDLKADSMNSCYDESCQIEIGKELAANKVIATRISSVGHTCLIASYLLDLRTSATDWTTTVTTDCTEDALLVAMGKVADKHAARAEAATPKKAKVTTGSASIISVPAANFARVLVDGVERGTKTPMMVSGLAAGEHEVRVETEEREGVGKVTVQAGETRSARIELKPLPARLAIRSVPGGAEIAIDGTTKGKAPVTVTVPPGRVEIHARSAGYAGVLRADAKPSRSPREVVVEMKRVESSATSSALPKVSVQPPEPAVVPVDAMDDDGVSGGAIALLSSGVAVAVTGVVVGVVDPDGVESVGAEVAANIMVYSGAAMAVGGLIWLLVD